MKTCGNIDIAAEKNDLGYTVQIAAQLSQSRARLYERADPDLPMPLLAVLTIWTVCLFVSFCLFSPVR